jgi:hypothetical protein
MAPVTDAGAILLTGGIAALVAIWGVISQRNIARRQHTMEHMAKTDNDNDMIDARRMFIQMAKQATGLVSYADADKEHTPESEAIRLVLNDFELTAVGIQMGVMDYEFYKRYNRGTVIRYWNHAAPYIYALRARVGSNLVFHEYEEMVRWFSKRAPRRSFWWRVLF